MWMMLVLKGRAIDAGYETKIIDTLGVFPDKKLFAAVLATFSRSMQIFAILVVYLIY